MKEEIGKSAILTTGIGMVSTGAALISDGQIEGGVVLVSIGFGLIVTYVYLMEKETIAKVLKVLK